MSLLAGSYSSPWSSEKSRLPGGMEQLASFSNILRAREKIVWMKEKGILAPDDYKWIEHLEKRLDRLKVC